MSKRIVEYVGIGDVNPTAQLEIAPQHADDVALLVHGTYNGTQTGNLQEWRKSDDTLIGNMDIDGVLYCATLSADSSTIANTAVVTLSAGKIDVNTLAITGAYAVKINTATLTATTISGATSLYATTVTATTGNITTVNATTVSAGTVEQDANSYSITKRTVAMVAASGATNTVLFTLPSMTNGQSTGFDLFVTALSTAGSDAMSAAAFRYSGMFVCTGVLSAVVVGTPNQTSCGSAISTATLSAGKAVPLGRVPLISIIGSANDVTLWVGTCTTYTTTPS